MLQAIHEAESLSWRQTSTKAGYNAFLTSALRVGEINSTPPSLYPLGQSRRPGAR